MNSKNMRKKIIMAVLSGWTPQKESNESLTLYGAMTFFLRQSVLSFVFKRRNFQIFGNREKIGN